MNRLPSFPVFRLSGFSLVRAGWSGLTGKFAVVLVIVSALLLTVSGYFQQDVAGRYLQSLLDEQLQRTTERLALSLRAPIYSYDADGLVEIIQAEMRADAVSGVFVYEGQRMTHGYVKNGTDVVESQAFPPEPLHVSAERPIMSDGAQIGSVRVFVDTSGTRTAMKAFRWATLIQALVLELALVIAVILMVRMILIHPLGRAMAFIRRVAEGDLTAICGMSGKGEIGELTADIDRMAANLRREIGRAHV